MKSDNNVQQRVLIIEPYATWHSFFTEMWLYREVFYFLVWRDMLVRYKQTLLGIGWVLIRPFITMVIFTLLFGKLAGFSHASSIPYPVIVLSALLPWQFFADSLQFGHTSFVGNSSMISKIYIPRIFIPLSTVVCSLLDLVIALGMLVGMMVWYGIVPTYRLIFLPGAILWLFLLSSATALFFASITLRYRDFRFIVLFILQCGLYVSPVGFSLQMIPPVWHRTVALNPLVGIIGLFRWIFTQEALSGGVLLISGVVTVVLILISGIYFHRVEESFADII